MGQQDKSLKVETWQCHTSGVYDARCDGRRMQLFYVEAKVVNCKQKEHAKFKYFFVDKQESQFCLRSMLCLVSSKVSTHHVLDWRGLLWQ